MVVNKQTGFTLFEMLVVISIIAILSALVSLSFSSAQKKARDSRRLQDMKTIQTSAEQFYSQNGYVYPVGTNTPDDWTTSSGQVVLNIFPSDPKGIGWTQYYYPGNVGSTYCACAAVESVNNGNATDYCVFGSGTGTTGPYFCVKNQQ